LCEILREKAIGFTASTTWYGVINS